MGYKEDLRLELKFAQQIKGILGMAFIRQDINADLKQGTDFLVFTINPIKVAARLRTYEYLLKYPDQFTIRWSRPSGVKTEIHKIREGLVDYLFYGFVNANETNIIRYFIGDLNIFRANEPMPVAIHENLDKSSELAAYSLSQLPEQFFKHKHFPKSQQLKLINVGID